MKTQVEKSIFYFVTPIMADGPFGCVCTSWFEWNRNLRVRMVMAAATAIDPCGSGPAQRLKVQFIGRGADG